MLVIDKCFDELSVGYKTGKSQGRTMTESDVVNFCMLTGNWLQIHSDVEFSKHSHFGQRLVQGSLVFSVLPGLLNFGDFVSAFYGVDNLRFVKPVFIGDTVYLEAEVIRHREKDDKHGVLTYRMNVTNQRDELVQKSEFSLLMLRQRP